MHIGTMIRQLRHDKGYTLKDFGEKIGMSVSFLSDIENGKSRPSLKRCKEIAAGFKVPVSILLGESISENYDESDRPYAVSFNCMEGKQVSNELNDFDKWNDSDKQELISYLRAKRLIRNNNK